MSATRAGAPGSTRTCPHCRETILESASVCPACRHHLRFSAGGAAERAPPSAVPLRVEGFIEQPSASAPCEYSVLLCIRNEKGEEIARRVVGVGAMQPAERRSFMLSVEVFRNS